MKTLDSDDDAINLNRSLTQGFEDLERSSSNLSEIQQMNDEESNEPEKVAAA